MTTASLSALSPSRCVRRAAPRRRAARWDDLSAPLTDAFRRGRSVGADDPVMEEYPARPQQRALGMGRSCALMSVTVADG